MSEEIYKRLRPKKLTGVVGQDATVAAVEAQLAKGRWPHAAVFHGPSGTGKTTTARIVRRRLGVRSDLDYKEVNIAQTRGVNDVKKILEGVGMAPLGGSKCRLYVFDEMHQMTKDGQNCVLKVLEDCPDHVYFILCTTEVQKLVKAIRTRCTPFKFGLVDPKAVKELIQSTCETEEIEATEKVVDEIVATADGSPREALVLLDLAASLSPDEDKMLSVVRAGGSRTVAFDLVKALVFPPRGAAAQEAYWKDKIVPMLKSLDDDPEGVRQLVLKFAETMLFKGHQRSAFLLYCFQDPVHYNGRAGLTFAAYRTLNEFEE